MRILCVGNEPVACDAICTDVSVRGLGFNTWAQLRVGEAIEFEFLNADHSGLTCKACILYRAGEHYGAYFLTHTGFAYAACDSIHPRATSPSS